MSLNKFTDISKGYDLKLDIGADQIKCNSLIQNGQNSASYQFSNTQDNLINFIGAGTYTVLPESTTPLNNNTNLELNNSSQYTVEVDMLTYNATYVFVYPLHIRGYIGNVLATSVSPITSFDINSLISFKMKIAVVSGAGTASGIIKVLTTQVYKTNLSARVEEESYSLITVNLMSGLASVKVLAETTEPNPFAITRKIASITCDYL